MGPLNCSGGSRSFRQINKEKPTTHHDAVMDARGAARLHGRRIVRSCDERSLTTEQANEGAFGR
jgi:hypothetical protein